MRDGDKMLQILGIGVRKISDFFTKLAPPIESAKQTPDYDPLKPCSGIGRDRALMSERCAQTLLASAGEAPRFPEQRYAVLVEQARRVRYEQGALKDYYANLTSSLLSDTGPLALLDKMLQCAGEDDATQWRVYHNFFAIRMGRIAAVYTPDADDEHIPSFTDAGADDIDRLVAILEEHPYPERARDLYGDMIVLLREVAARDNDGNLMRWSGEVRARLRDVLARMPDAVRREMLAQYGMFAGDERGSHTNSTTGGAL